jgi:hypothetical protein
MRWFSRWYGAGPLHLLTMIGCAALAGYAVLRFPPHNAVGIAAWFAGAVIGHDLVLVPLYTLADRSVTAVFRHRAGSLPVVPGVNYLRVPAALSGLLLLIWFPLVLRLPRRYTAATTLPVSPYLWHWLAVTGALFLASAALFALRLRPRRRRPPGHRRQQLAADKPAGQSQPDTHERYRHPWPDTREPGGYPPPADERGPWPATQGWEPAPDPDRPEPPGPGRPPPAHPGWPRHAGPDRERPADPGWGRD